MKYVGYYNGKLGPLEEMTVPMNDRAVYFGDGVYEATMSVRGVPFALEEHLDRFENSLKMLRIEMPMPREELKKELLRCCAAADDAQCLLYWQCSRGTAMRGHAFPTGVKPNLMITLKPAPMKPPCANYKLITVEDTRFLHCNIKTLNLIPSVMANQMATERGCNEAVFHRGERVTEGSHSNVLILKDGVLHTAPTDNLILPGITRKHLLLLAAENGIPTDETAFTLDDLRAADEILITSSGALCNAACELDGVPCGGKAQELLHILQNAYVQKFDRETKA